jgi:hypothetical protein
LKVLEEERIAEEQRQEALKQFPEMRSNSDSLMREERTRLEQVRFILFLIDGMERLCIISTQANMIISLH